MSPQTHSRARSLIRAHFDLNISPGDEREMRLHLAECTECSVWYERHLLIATLDPKAPNAQRRLASGLGLKSKAGQGFSLQLGFALAAVAALVLLLVKKPEEFAARGGEQGAELAQVFVYRVEPGRAGQAVASTIRASEELAFAYVNAAGFSKLMIFGEDEHGHVYWYHPAWSNEAHNPRSIAIGSGPELRELPESIAHDIDGKSLKIRAIFSNHELSVREVEKLLAEQRANPGAASSLSARLGEVKEVGQALTVE
ncbi:MAG TPA: hypothetical protein VM686_32890 [Polyangiaceae bacterium]|nr:hypothetical protein [Polyangiaceae bacterium]